MSRRKPSTVTRTHVSVRAQDQSAFSRRLLELVGEDITDDLDERISDLEDELLGLSPGDVGIVDVDLDPGASGGSLVVEPEGGFTESAVGRPVVASQGPTDGDPFGIVAFTAEVLDTRRLQVHWSADRPHGRRATLHFLIG